MYGDVLLSLVQSPVETPDQPPRPKGDSREMRGTFLGIDPSPAADKNAAYDRRIRDGWNRQDEDAAYAPDAVPEDVHEAYHAGHVNGTRAKADLDAAQRERRRPAQYTCHRCGKRDSTVRLYDGGSTYPSASDVLNVALCAACEDAERAAGHEAEP